MQKIKHEIIRDYLSVLIILLFGCIIGILGVYMNEANLPKRINALYINRPPNPSDYINLSQIKIYPTKFCVEVNNSRVVRYSNTGSMKNVLDENSNGIQIPINETNISIGDIISYKHNDSDEHLIAHRVIDIKTENNETYYLLKGDNTINADGWINYSQIYYKTIAIIY